MYVHLLISLIFQLLRGQSSTHESDYEGRNAKQVPSEYTLYEQIKLPFRVDMVVLSPDQNWIVYTKERQSNYSEPNNELYFQSRGTEVQSCKVIFGSDQSDYISRRDSMKFSEKGDLLFLGTQKGMIYMCQCSGGNRQSSGGNRSYSGIDILWNCDKSINITGKDDKFLWVTSIDVNKQNQVSSVRYPNDKPVINILQLKEGQLVQKDAYVSQEERYFPNCIRRHPIDQDMFVLIKNLPGYLLSRMDLINITSKSTLYSANVSGQLGTLQFSKDGGIVLVSTDKGVYPYSYSPSRLYLINSTYDKGYKGIKVAADSKKLIAFSYSIIELLSIKITNIDQHSKSNQRTNPFYQPQIQAFSPQIQAFSPQIQAFSPQIQAFSPQIQDQNHHDNIIAIKLKSIALIEDAIYLDSSLDNNKILTFDSRSEAQLTINVYSLCLNGTFFSDINCQKCSQNCSNCYFDEKTCTSCPNTSYLLLDNVCYPCSLLISNCSACQNQHSQLVCFTCFDFFFLFSPNQCKACDSYGGCKSCFPETNCTKCDLNKGYDEMPLNGKCQCRRGFSVYNNKCIQCSIFGCLQCQQSNKCKKCDQSKGFNEIANNNGSCQCSSNYTQANQYCIQCSLAGCIKCEQANKCSQCADQGYELSEDKKCIKRQDIDTDNNAYVYLGSGLGAVVLVGIGVVFCCKCRRRRDKREPLIGEWQKRQQGAREREQIRRDVNEEIIHREGRLDQPLIQEYIEKAKYSDEERIRLKSLFLNPSLNQK